MSNGKKKFRYVEYVLAWITYAGNFLTKVGNIGNVISDSFNDIHPPKKDEYYI